MTYSEALILIALVALAAFGAFKALGAKLSQITEREAEIIAAMKWDGAPNAPTNARPPPAPPPPRKPPEKKGGGFGGFLEGALDFAIEMSPIGDIKTLMDPNASVFDKVLAGVSLVSSVVPGAGQVVKAGVVAIKVGKAANKTADAVDSARDVKRASDEVEDGASAVGGGKKKKGDESDEPNDADREGRGGSGQGGTGGSGQGGTRSGQEDEPGGGKGGEESGGNGGDSGESANQVPTAASVKQRVDELSQSADEATRERLANIAKRVDLVEKRLAKGKLTREQADDELARLNRQLDKVEDGPSAGTPDDVPKSSPQDLDPPGTEYKEPIPGLTGKQGAKDVPSWVRNEGYPRPRVGERGEDYANRILNHKYGEGNWERGPDTEHNEIQKWADRNFQ